MTRILGVLLTMLSTAINLLSGRRRSRFVQATEADCLAKFQALFFCKEGVLLPLEYLSRAEVYFCKNIQGKVVGGFALVVTGPFRSLQQIPVAVRALGNVRLEEVNGVWLDSSPSLHRRIRFWTFFIGVLLKSPGNAIVYAVDAKKVALRGAVFNHIREWTLFEGVVNNLEGMSSEKKSIEAVEVSYKAQITSFLFQHLCRYALGVTKYWVRSKPAPMLKVRCMVSGGETQEAL